MNGYLSFIPPDEAHDQYTRLLWNWMPTRYLGEHGDAARAHRANQLYGSHLMSTPQPAIAADLADQYVASDRAKADAYRRMVREAGQTPPGILGTFDNVARRLAQQASFGGADYIEGLANSLLYDTDFDDAFRLSRHRTERAADDLGPWATPIVDIAGTMAGYLTALPRLPAAFAGRGLLSPAAAALEGTRGYLSTPGDVERRLRAGATHGLDPLSWLNPTTMTGTGSLVAAEPLATMTGFEDYLPAAALERLLR